MRTLFVELNKSFFEYISKKNFNKAEQIIEKMIESGLYKHDIYYYKGRLEHERGNYTKGLSYLNKSIHIKHGNYLDYLAKGNIYYDIEKYKNALREYYKAFIVKKEDEVINFNIAMCLWYLKRYKEALKFFKRAAKFSKKLDVTLVKFYGNSLEAVGQFREALNLYTKAIRKFPLNAELYELKGDALMYLDKFTEANRYYTKAIKINPDEHRIFYRKALNFHLWAESIKNTRYIITKKQKLFNEAVRWYSTCIRNKIEIKDSAIGKSECQLALGEAIGSNLQNTLYTLQ